MWVDLSVALCSDVERKRKREKDVLPRVVSSASPRDFWHICIVGKSSAMAERGPRDAVASLAPRFLFFSFLPSDAKVGDWNGKKLDSQGNTRIELFPDNNRSADLQAWWNRVRHLRLLFFPFALCVCFLYPPNRRVT